ncbi:MAG: nucleotidyl transferase AbiEii/AbiGii toxin family protein [Candidatus Pacebacteria bacterium]|nr:nucleotidyl transferase AbiEii/AbiGii toxin family protein [Candidatus Paceibacterota bacterium]
MILPNTKDTIHKAWLYRLLSGIYDEPQLAGFLYFKGGTCAAMLGYLDRFSVDLDFDFTGKKEDVPMVQKKLEKVFRKLGMEIKDRSKNVPQYFLKYPAKDHERNTIKLDVTFPPPLANKYEPKEFADIDRIITCQTIETMFANKLVALIDRYEKNESIAGRDLYDIHHFFFQGFTYDKEVIEERRKKSVAEFFRELADFIEKNITETIINQDLNSLLAPDQFQKIRKILKRETLMFLRDEIKRSS